ncbi:hypothetical protein M378DRAFT_23029 [Amanita muscaria Koide BX008]|uniref:C2H2-type domain-containing protein n=1 Tax=Amanita muscaria (strain Koide BX008) TaxID=946122 RepID=A0A0C2TJA0_AMAMK|nr:hypothetical protein M378DRAFT_23029 [Amanita muscaria Koide BX008]
MATQKITHQGVDPPQGVTETPLSPVATILPRHDIDDGTVDAAGASFHPQEYQTRASTSPWVSGLPRHSSYHPSDFANTQQHNHDHAPLNYQWQSQQRAGWQSFNPMTQSPIPHPQSSLHPMSPVSPTTAAVRTNANHAFAGTHVEARPNIINLPPADSSLHGIAEPPAPTTPQNPPTCTLIPITADGKRYRCQCGHQTKNAGDMERHHESLKHSEPKHVCACGKKYSRKDSLARHEKKCPMKTQEHV